MADIKFCPACGIKFEIQNPRFCSACGKALTADVQESSTYFQQQRYIPQKNEKVEKFMDEVVSAVRNRSQSKTKVEYESEEIRKEADSQYREGLAALTMALAMILKPDLD